MNRRNKAKAASTTAQVKQTPQPPRQTSQTPAKATPLAKPTPPPPPKATPSQLLRKEWQSFDIWFRARREEKNKRVSERKKEALNQRSKSRLQKPSDFQDLSKFEIQQNEELAGQARTEWLRRLSVAGLNEDDWTDMTEGEMAAICAAFEPEQAAAAAPTAYGGATAQAAGQSQFAGQQQQWYGGPPGAWDAPSTTAAKAPNGKAAPPPAVPNRASHTPILVSAHRLRDACISLSPSRVTTEPMATLHPPASPPPTYCGRCT